MLRLRSRRYCGVTDRQGRSCRKIRRSANCCAAESCNSQVLYRATSTALVRLHHAVVITARKLPRSASGPTRRAPIHLTDQELHSSFTRTRLATSSVRTYGMRFEGTRSTHGQNKHPSAAATTRQRNYQDETSQPPTPVPNKFHFHYLVMWILRPWIIFPARVGSQNHVRAKALSICGTASHGIPEHTHRNLAQDGARPSSRCEARATSRSSARRQSSRTRV